MFGSAFGGLVLFFLALTALRLLIPLAFRYVPVAMVYMIVLLLFFNDWYVANTKLGDGIFFALVGLSLLLPLLVKIVRTVLARIGERALIRKAALAQRRCGKPVQIVTAKDGRVYIK